MKKEYDFSVGKRGAVIPKKPGKTRITIRIDDDVLEWFHQKIDEAGGGNYQTLMNLALRRFIETKDDELESLLRRIVREELARHANKRTAR